MTALRVPMHASNLSQLVINSAQPICSSQAMDVALQATFAASCNFLCSSFEQSPGGFSALPAGAACAIDRTMTAAMAINEATRTLVMPTFLL